jgi:uncharacterized integral membrane protein
MRLVFLLLAILAVVLGIVFGALNGHEVELDFHYRTLTLPLGVALLWFAFLGAVAAGALLWIGVIFPQGRRIAVLRRQLVEAATSSSSAADATPAAGNLPPP